MDSFNLLEGKLGKLARERFRQPTPIQEKSIPLVVKGKNLLLISETGSGKTESVLLPVFNQFLKQEHKPISILYITPLKSLNRDLLKRLEWWAEKLDFEISVRHGDTSQYERGMQAENPADMFITTPETLQAMLVGKKMREHLRNVKWVVVDEVHELVDSKRGVQLSLGLERLKRLVNQEPKGDFNPYEPRLVPEKKTGKREVRSIQIISLSATVGSPQKVADFLGGNFEIVDAERRKVFKVSVDSPSASKDDILQSRKMMVSPETAARVRNMRDLILGRKSVLVFTNTRETAEVLSSRMKLFDPRLPIETHHSSLSKEVRIRAEKDFKEQKLKALLCTSSLELGIDIGEIDFVMQYFSPRQVNKLLQRIGRAGHSIERVSEGLILSGDWEDSFESAVIAARGKRKEIEETFVYMKALDVLAQQVVGLALEDYEVNLGDAYNVLSRAYVYKDLSPEEFFEVCRMMERLRIVWINWTDGRHATGLLKSIESSGQGSRESNPLLKGKLSDLVLKRRKNAWLYYYKNLSTIPDVKSYKIHDAYSNQPVGSLDAEFIALHGSAGQGVIVKGQAWRILDVGRDKVTVEPMSGIEAAIPAWEGELIPVPFEVAQEVGRLRKKVLTSPEEVLKEYPVTRKVMEKMAKAAKAQKAWGFVPDDREILVEHDPENVIFHTCWGSLVNDTIGRVLGVILSERIGSVGLKTDPYRIIIKIGSQDGYGDKIRSGSRSQKWKSVVEAFIDLKPGMIEPALKESLPKTELFHFRFLHVAKRLGIIERDADFGKGYLKKIIEVYSGTPVYHEAINEIFQDKLDVPKSVQVISDLRERKFSLTIKEGISPFGKAALDKRYEIVPPDRPEAEIFQIFKNRLLETHVGLVCTHCGNWGTVLEAGKVKKDLKCTKCRSGMIGIVPQRHLLDAQSLIKKKIAGKILEGEEAKWLNLTLDSASLFLAHRSNAAIALAGRGVGVRTAGRILARMQKGDQLIKDILEAERNYVKTRRFWRD